MLDATEPDPGSQDIILLGCDRSYRMIQGEDHISAMLADEGSYPTPVYCVSFASIEDMAAFLRSGGKAAEELWAIHPNIVDRLQHRGELSLVTLPDPEPEG